VNLARLGCYTVHKNRILGLMKLCQFTLHEIRSVLV
jgi:hypothetical protein